MSDLVEKPWGRYEVLAENDTYLVKRLVVEHGHRLSYQSHKERSEIWAVVRGAGLVTINGGAREALCGSVVVIPKGAKHRLSNPHATELVIIETQLGDRLSESDIVRYEDDYGRQT